MEYILCAAVLVPIPERLRKWLIPPPRSHSYPEGALMFTGWRHGDALMAVNAWEKHLDPRASDEIGIEILRGKHQGFMTSKGRFVDRVEAAVIAAEAGQCEDKDWLSSEDIY